MQKKLYQRQKLICIDGKMAFYIAYIGETIKKVAEQNTLYVLRRQEHFHFSFICFLLLPFISFHFFHYFQFYGVPLFHLHHFSQFLMIMRFCWCISLWCLWPFINISLYRFNISFLIFRRIFTINSFPFCT